MVFNGLLLLLAIFTAVAVKRHPHRVRRLFRTVAREVQTRLGTYSLAMVMESMLDQMHASAIPSLTRSYIPNEMTFGMHPRDVRRWGKCFDELATELCGLMLRSIADKPQLSLSEMGLIVRLVSDEQATPGRPTLEAKMTGKRKPAPDTARPRSTFHDGATIDDRTELVTAPEDEFLTATAPARWQLVFPDGGVELLCGETIVGRGRDAGIRLDTRDVSRSHARLALLHDKVSVTDLQSGNGTFVNEQQIDMSMLGEGDEIRFGANATARLERV